MPRVGRGGIRSSGAIGFMPSGELGRQAVGVHRREHPHAAAAEEGEVVAVEGASVGAVVAMGGAGRAEAGHAVRGAGAGAAAAMHAAAQLAVDGRGAAGAACSGASAATRDKGEVGVASAFGGWWGR